MSLILFSLGLPKSGTSTLQDALMRAGCKSVHWYSKKSDAYVGASLYKRYFSGHTIAKDFEWAQAITQADLLTTKTSYWPQMDFALLRELKRQNPSMQFMLNLRDPLKTANSMMKWGNFMERLWLMGAPGIPARAARSERNLLLWIEGHYASTKSIFGDQLVTYDVEDPNAASHLSDALGLDFKWWGHSNKSHKALNRGFVS